VAPYHKVIAKKAPQALNIADSFHIMRKFNEAIDEIRRDEVKSSIDTLLSIRTAPLL
jgi:transposase